jgi:hypothetical protein
MFSPSRFRKYTIGPWAKLFTNQKLQFQIQLNTNPSSLPNTLIQHSTQRPTPTKAHFPFTFNNTRVKLALTLLPSHYGISTPTCPVHQPTYPFQLLIPRSNHITTPLHYIRPQLQYNVLAPKFTNGQDQKVIIQWPMFLLGKINWDPLSLKHHHKRRRRRSQSEGQ